MRVIARLGSYAVGVGVVVEVGFGVRVGRAVVGVAATRGDGDALGVEAGNEWVEVTGLGV